MAKYQKYNPRDRAAPRPWKIHPIWRGIGCLMMIIIPIMAWAGATLLVEENSQRGWLPMPAQLAQTVTLPGLGAIPFFYANLIVTAALALVGFGLLTVIYSLIFSTLGPPRYGPLDAPPEPRRPRKRR